MDVLKHMVPFLAVLLNANYADGHSLNISTPFRIDVHSHIIPDFYHEALIEGGFPVVDGVVYTDGFPVPAWDLTSHVETMDLYSVNYSTLSVSSPGVSYLAADEEAAGLLARKLNLAMYNYTQLYPKRLGAMCLLPLPHVQLALAEIDFCLDTLKFDGVGLYTNTNGTYLGDSLLDPVLQVLNNRSATVFVHPAAPGCSSVNLGYPSPMTEYPFDSVRAMESLLISGQRANYSAINIIFPHGGGAMPYLATRIAGVANMALLGALNIVDSLAQFQGYIFDTASTTSAAQLWSLREFYGGDLSHIVIGTDYPYVPTVAAQAALQTIPGNGNFSASDMALINSQNALNVFPRIVEKLSL